MFLVQPEVSELLVLEATVSDQGAPQQNSGGAASCSVLPAVGDGRLHGPKTKHLHLRNWASQSGLNHSTCSRQEKAEATVPESVCCPLSQSCSDHLLSRALGTKHWKSLLVKMFASTLLTAIILSNSWLKYTLSWLMRDISRWNQCTFDCQYWNQS